MSSPDFWKILLSSIFPNGIPPHQYGNLAVLSIYITELEELYDQIEQFEKDNGGNIICRNGDGRQDAKVTKSTLTEAIKSPRSSSDVSPKPFIAGTYPTNFEDAPIKPTKKRMGRPPREPGSLGITCPKCGSDDVVSGGKGRIKCKACGSCPTVDQPHFSDRIDERILALEFDDLTPDEISEKLREDGASIAADEIQKRLMELHTAEVIS